ncbi:uncharacterized protein si:ch211-276i12.4 [Syngnathoides biaculeatus]|uniref:uncharacterized protein si:ch211-276i12.4 n=1 Tax=Syngnathoides biaculeatus TaxID=300417 RepID=UPI002ADD3631|nr:uncharacterized protein si:ch211-276i12.4 [Syngnathoides biaculeatus]XP_061690174.1 uncharacterized protein si:ch211-276i12.4 [Syngnathoides biaculeatus]XP_061690175.1 uncharacterized protein si:ch211-276i12.4 [Syngnathoides biaculeatus]XP_061690176.1 uncharacterized protein si:ch211-276i12.4 [Syngnathoides biaculeatus]XP_061690177.1 uncharacterized protein si:ch211-276i12.4 [Syngnathoides biaculeatus]XP_061690178.1 uncharacterized protein si:ch211-276i12.4 [Syngnathoides biaculeatus]
MHGDNGSAVGGPAHGSTKQSQRGVFSSLDRNHSRSEEGLLKSSEGQDGNKQSKAPNSGNLYKTSSLNRSLTFSDEDLLLGNSRGPKRAVSSSQLPSKGILKKKDPQADIRKAKSMEVISPRVAKRQDPSAGGQKGKGIDHGEMDRVKANFLQGKLQFSAFLDEITKQVISPSYLTILGVNNKKVASKTCAPLQTLDSGKPELPPKKHRKSSGVEREQYPKHHNRQDKSARGIFQKHRDSSNPDKLISYATRKHQGSPPPHHYTYSPRHNAYHGSGRKEKRLPTIGGSLSEDRYDRCGSHLTDGTSTSPELSQPKMRPHCNEQTHTIYSSHTQHFPQPQPQHMHTSASQQGTKTSPPSSVQGARVGCGSESLSSKSDSSRTRDTASTTTSHSSEQYERHHSEHVGSSKQCIDRLCHAEQLQVLQEENADLHQNLLQTVVCIESLESELQRTRDELTHVKDKYKSLLETHTGTRQAKNILGEHLHIASESPSNERKYLVNRVSQLSSELEGAHRTIAALENINLPCLIKDLLEKHFESPDAVHKFLTPSAASSPSALKPLHASNSEEAVHNWLTESKTATAFVPFKQEVPKTGVKISVQDPFESSNSLPFSVEDISTAIYQKMVANAPTYQQQASLGIKQTGSPLKPQQLHRTDRLGEKEEVLVTLLEQDATGVTSTSAQQILDEFMQQLHTRERVGEGKAQE